MCITTESILLWSTERTLNFYLLLWRKAFDFRGKKKTWQIWKYDCDLGKVPEMGESDAFMLRGSLTAAFIPLIAPAWLMSYFEHLPLSGLCINCRGRYFDVQLCWEVWWKNILFLISLDCVGHHGKFCSLTDVFVPNLFVPIWIFFPWRI